MGKEMVIRRIFSFERLVQRPSVRLKLASLAIVVIFGVASLSFLVMQPFVTTSAVVGFTFPQAETGSYPNGVPFSVSDVTSRSVLEVVWRANQLETQGLSLDDFVRSISVSPTASNEEFLKARYQNLLSRKGLTSAEVSAFEKEYKMELDAQLNRGAKITMTVPILSRIHADVRVKVLEDIPAEWARQAISKLGALQLPSVTVGFVERDYAEKTSLFQKAGYFYTTADELRESLKALEKSPGGGALRDPDTGRSVADLLRKLDDVERFGVLEFDIYVQQGVMASEEVIKSIEARFLELRDRRRSLLDSAETYRMALQDYDAQKQGAPKATVGEDGRPGDRAPQLNIEVDALQRLMELGGRAKDQEYRQKLTEKRIAAEVEARSLDIEIARHERRIQGARKTVNKFSEEKLHEMSAVVAANLKALSAASARVQAMHSLRFADSRGQLYSGPDIQSGSARTVTAYFRLPSILAVLVLLFYVGVELWIALLAEGFFRRQEENDMRGRESSGA